MLILALLCIIIGILLMTRSVPKKEEGEEKRGFLVLVGSILFIWFYPGLALFIIGIACLIAILNGCVI